MAHTLVVTISSLVEYGIALAVQSKVSKCPSMWLLFVGLISDQRLYLEPKHLKLTCDTQCVVTN
jgi:hypothetical protein